MEYVLDLFPGIPATWAISFVAGLGLMIAGLAFVRLLGDRRTVAAGRMAAASGPSHARRAFAGKEMTPSGLLKGVVPAKAEERFAVTQGLARAGFRGSNALVLYYVVRIALGFGLPLVFLGMIALARHPAAPVWMIENFLGLSTRTIVQVIGVLVFVGFFGPSKWLNARIKNRRQKIEDAFPNMLDLLQVGVEAGMGFDQALLKVATEIQSEAPDIAEEIILTLSEIHAGRDRDTSLMHMAKRTGLEEMSSFVNVILQSARFGTPMSDALTVYADEMRNNRELRAHEKANKLPVQMSAVMASLMLPSLIALILAPIILRYMQTFG